MKKEETRLVITKSETENKKVQSEEKNGGREQKNQLRCIHMSDPEYPERLKKYPDMPSMLYCLGNLPREDVPTVAMVGARMCSSYGLHTARSYAAALARRGVQIISGMALGIDAQSHWGAVDAGTPTFAVLGCGADVCYPSSNRQLYDRILAGGGGILSEFPPGAAPLSWHFPARNRVISALADLVLVVEAKQHSGSLITANYALDQGKTVYAVPGQVDDALSRGCNRLIFDGAGIAYCPEVLLEELGISPERSRKNGRNAANQAAGRKMTGLSEDLNAVYHLLSRHPQNPEYFIAQTGYPPQKVSSILTELTLMGLAQEEGRHYYVLGDG